MIAASLEDDRAGLRAALMGYNNVTRGKVDGLFAAAKQSIFFFYLFIFRK